MAATVLLIWLINSALPLTLASTFPFIALFSKYTKDVSREIVAKTIAAMSPLMAYKT